MVSIKHYSIPFCLYNCNNNEIFKKRTTAITKQSDKHYKIIRLVEILYDSRKKKRKSKDGGQKFWKIKFKKGGSNLSCHRLQK